MLLLRSNIPINLSAIGCLHYIMVVLCIFAALSLGFCNFSEPNGSSGGIIYTSSFSVDFPFIGSLEKKTVHGAAKDSLKCIIIEPTNKSLGLIFYAEKHGDGFDIVCYNPMPYAIDPPEISFTIKLCDQ